MTPLKLGLIVATKRVTMNYLEWSLASRSGSPKSMCRVTIAPKIETSDSVAFLWTMALNCLHSSLANPAPWIILAKGTSHKHCHWNQQRDFRSPYITTGLRHIDMSQFELHWFDTQKHEHGQLLLYVQTCDRSITCTSDNYAIYYIMCFFCICKRACMNVCVCMCMFNCLCRAHMYRDFRLRLRNVCWPNHVAYEYLCMFACR